MKRLLPILTVVVLASLSLAPAASAAVSVVGGPYTGLKASGDTVRLQLSNFPTTAGLYILQCLITTGRPSSTQCNPASQVWVSTLPGATFKPTDTIAISVMGTFGSVNCLTSSCGLFFRLDHTALPTDTSEDRFISLSFVTSATPTLPLDEITTKVGSVTLAPNAIGTLAYRTPVTLSISTKSGLVPTVKVYGEGCTATGETITALKGSGQCDIAVTSPGNDSYAAVTSHYPVNLQPGVQSIALKLPKQIVGSKLLLTSKALTNMGEKPKVSISPAGVCALKRTGVNTMVLAKGKGVCAITITAPGRDGLYNALNQTFTINVKAK